MSVGYTWVQWSRHKRVYDAVAAGAVVGYVAAFVVLTTQVWKEPHDFSGPVVLMRALGSCAIVMLHVILVLGPLARLDRRFLPLVYNRRHLGVMTFLVALAHGVVAVGFYHGFGTLNPLVSLMATNTNYFSLRAFPYQTLGLGALVVMFLMAATSHDFWLKNLSACAWKRLHMLIYPAYVLLVGHVALGALQGDRGWLAGVLVSVGAGAVVALHLAAAWRERRRDRAIAAEAEPGWLDVCGVGEIPLHRARVVCPPGAERIAVFRDGDSISAVTNVCAHQGGPLGEGRIIQGCITCPWHGWQYRARDGCSPPPFTEKIVTYQVRIVGDRVQVNPHGLPPGTAVEPAQTRESTRA